MSVHECNLLIVTSLRPTAPQFYQPNVSDLRINLFGNFISKLVKGL